MKITGNLTIASALASILLFVPTFSFADALDTVGSAITNTASGAADTAKDSAITTAVKASLLVEPDIKSFNISVTTANGVVFLTGQVDTQLQANKAVEIAQSVSGVKDVDSSKLSVKDSASYLQDAFTTAKVKGQILQLFNDGKISKGYSLHVETTDGDVHIMGTVTKRSDIERVKNSVKSISGVKNVGTDIEVKR